MEVAVRTLATLAAVMDTAADVIERAHADGTDLDGIGSTLDVARSICERITQRAQRETRSAHTWFHGGTTFGDESAVSPAPDGYERVRAHTRTERTNKGATVDMVTVHGRAYVVGSSQARAHKSQSMSAERIARAIDSAPRATGGVDAIALARLTDEIYRDEIPRLIGGDVLSFEEWQSGGVVRTSTYRPVRHPSRYRLTTIRARKGEQSQSVTFHDGQSVTRLLAPCDSDHAFIGHKRYVRPSTVRTVRATRRRVADETYVIADDAPLAESLASLALIAPESGPYRVTWAHGSNHGSMTRRESASGTRWTVSQSGRKQPLATVRRVDTIAHAVAANY